MRVPAIVSSRIRAMLRQGLAVGADELRGHVRPREPLDRALPARRAEPSPQLAVAQQALERVAQAGDVAGLDDEAGLAVDHQVEEAADAARDHRLPVRHRLGAGDPEAFAVGRTRDDGGGRVQRLEVVPRQEPERLWDTLAERPLAPDHEPEAGPPPRPPRPPP